MPTYTVTEAARTIIDSLVKTTNTNQYTIAIDGPRITLKPTYGDESVIFQDLPVDTAFIRLRVSYKSLPARTLKNLHHITLTSQGILFEPKDQRRKKAFVHSANLAVESSPHKTISRPLLAFPLDSAGDLQKMRATIASRPNKEEAPVATTTYREEKIMQSVLLRPTLQGIYAETASRYVAVRQRISTRGGSSSLYLLPPFWLEHVIAPGLVDMVRVVRVSEGSVAWFEVVGRLQGGILVSFPIEGAERSLLHSGVRDIWGPENFYEAGEHCVLRLRGDSLVDAARLVDDDLVSVSVDGGVRVRRRYVFDLEVEALSVSRGAGFLQVSGEVFRRLGDYVAAVGAGSGEVLLCWGSSRFGALFGDGFTLCFFVK